MQDVAFEDVLNLIQEFWKEEGVQWKIREIRKVKEGSGRVVFEVCGDITAIVEKMGIKWRLTVRKDYLVLGEISSILEIKVQLTTHDLVQDDLHLTLILDGMIEEIKRIVYKRG
ncbi:hypothetical protein [Thermococcus barophilus]|uniref:Uncharacterized protein n=1 Tax=Thermococcus barophilus TaxID=55802 RepID=A0A0S1XAS9_THEBA|nr:hypothetical protein [Thermococcus barophilus]ALM74863.1 hypothetical protein TBCH5v1_0912 [Thermococcus barophilus]